MPLIRTIFRPWEEQDVSPEEAAAMERMGLLSRIEPGEPEVIAEPEPETPSAPEPAAKPRRGKTNTPAATAEEVNTTDGSSEEGGQVEEG